MKNIFLKLILLIFTIEGLSALHGKIVFYDGTYVVGKVTKVDEASVYIVPIGLDTPEGVLVGNIDSLRMENGMVPVVNSAVKYFYDNVWINAKSQYSEKDKWKVFGYFMTDHIIKCIGSKLWNNNCLYYWSNVATTLKTETGH